MCALVLRPPAFLPSPDVRATEQLLLRARVVRENEPHYGEEDRHARYDAQGSERRTLGSISVAPDADWLATLTVPIPDDRVAFVRVERQGPLPIGYRGSEEAAELSMPVGEVEAVLAVLTGLAAHARRDGVLPPGSASGISSSRALP